MKGEQGIPLEKYDYCMEIHHDRTATLRDRHDRVLVEGGTIGQCHGSLVELVGDAAVQTGVVSNAIYFWRKPE